MSLDCAAHHMSFPVRNLERSREFYADVLGLAEIERPDIFGLGGAWFDAGPCQVHLVEVPHDADLGSPPPVCDPRARHAAFAVDDYQKTVEILAGRGFAVFTTSAEFGQCWVQDPDGHVIELIVAPQHQGATL